MVDALNKAGVPCAPVNTIAQSSAEEHLMARDVMVKVPDEKAGSMYVTGRVMKFNRSGMPVGSAPTIGQHTNEILSSLLGRTADEISELHTAGVV